MWRWTILIGLGLGTTRRKPRPASSTIFQPYFSRAASAPSSFMKVPIGLFGSLNA